mgnify:CR=1 FL=1
MKVLIGTKNPGKIEGAKQAFEKYFNVYATNKIIGMQLLTADVMEELIDFINNKNFFFFVFYQILLKHIV